MPLTHTSNCLISLAYVPPMFSKDLTWRGEQDGVDAPKESGKGAIHLSERSCGRAWGHSPPMLANGTRWREECATGAADFGNGIAAPVVASEGAINPFKRSYGRAWGHSPPMLMKGAKWREECAAGAAAKGIVFPHWW